MYLAKDFIETSEGLIFAIVESGTEQGNVLCFLRYIFSDKRWNKLNTEQANLFLKKNHPQYLYYSSAKQADLHAVPIDQIKKHHQPRHRLKSLLAETNIDSVENDLKKLCLLFEKNALNRSEIGVTGSILIAAQNLNSDIDLVFYSRKTFHLARKITQQLIVQGDCVDLDKNDWLEAYARRQCDLSFEDYIWHEQRKFNKAMINQRKFDLSLVTKSIRKVEQKYQKLKLMVLKVKIEDDTFAYDYPALFFIRHESIKSIVSYTATYTGQAKSGEWVEVSGILEQSSDGSRRIVVGSNREAKGEYIKAIRKPL